MQYCFFALISSKFKPLLVDKLILLKLAALRQ